MTASPRTSSPRVVLPHSYILDPTKAKVSSKRQLPCWNGRRKTKSNGISRRKKALNGGTGVPNSISLTLQPKKIRRSSRRSWHFWLNDALGGVLRGASPMGASPRTAAGACCIGRSEERRVGKG